MKKGFTLIEILAVVTIIGLIFVIALPKIINSLNSKKSDIDNTTNNLIISAAKMYVNDHNTKFDKIEGSVYCLPLTTLAKEEYLDSKVKNVTDDKDITNIKSVKISYDNTFHYEIVNKKDCSVINKNYNELNYLESTGTQYIDSGIKPNNQTKLQLVYNQIEISNSYDFKGIFGASTGNLNQLYSVQYSNVLVGQFGANNAKQDYNITLGTHFIQFGQEGCFFDNNIVELFSERTFSNPNNIYIFGRNLNNELNRPSKIQLLSFKIYDNNDLVRDFIPVLDNNGIACLFDKVENKYYYNQGTGEFLYG